MPLKRGGTAGRKRRMYCFRGHQHGGCAEGGTLRTRMNSAGPDTRGAVLRAALPAYGSERGKSPTFAG
eukprot:4183992-Alexandrium_andersonii.AAC.1